MKSIPDKPKGKFTLIFWMLSCCIFIDTAGQFIPIYFTNHGFEISFYIIVYILILVSLSFLFSRWIYKQDNHKRIYKSIFSLLIFSLSVILFGFFTIAKIMTDWTDATTIYIKKSHSHIRIVSRYLNEGAFGGGTEPRDYEVVLRWPITPFLKIETAIDTNKINKNEWVRKIETYSDDPN
jgi:amino acid transporter